MKNRLYYVIAFTAVIFGITISADIRQSPPDPSCPFDQWPCPSARK